MNFLDLDTDGTLVVLTVTVLMLAITLAFSVLSLRRVLKPLLQALTQILVATATVELEAVEIEACGIGTRCCQAPLPEAQAPQLVPATPTVPADEVAASARRKASRDRVDPETVTRIADRH